jgi:hypothetical protein
MIIYILVMSSMMLSLQASSAITYKLNEEGRFGEHVAAFIKTKWLARKYGLTFLYKPFIYTDELVMHTREQHYDALQARQFKNTTYIYKEAKTEIKPDNNTLYIAQWATELLDFRDICAIKDEDFLQEIRALLAPLYPERYAYQRSAVDGITIALHVRKGGGFDALPVIQRQVLRFPPDEFYLTQIKRIMAMFPGQHCYVYLFTDDPYPLRLAAQYRGVLKTPLVTIECRRRGNKHDHNVLEDLFTMTHYDCLVRANSGFSDLAQLMGDYKVIMYPVGYCTRKGKVIIDKTAVICKDPVTQVKTRSYVY